jgi:hypothetical protein
MTVPVLRYGSETWTQKRKKAKLRPAKMKFLRNGAHYTRRGQVRNTNIKEDLNIFNLSNKIQITVEISCPRMEDI